MLVIFDSCPATRQEFQSWAYKRNAQGEQLVGDDQYEDRNNHILDGVIGAEVNGHTYTEGRPVAAPVEWVPEDAPDTSHAGRI